MIYAKTGVGFGNAGGGFGSASTVGVLGCSVDLLPFRIDTVALPSFTSFSAPPVFFRPAAIPFLFVSLESVDTSFVDPDPIFLGLHLSLVLCYWLPHGTTPILVDQYLDWTSLAPSKVDTGTDKHVCTQFSSHLLFLNDAGNGIGQAGTGPVNSKLTIA